MPDPVVMARAGREGRVLVTFDKGFGERIFSGAEPAPSAGVVLFRLDQIDAAFVARVLLQLFSDRQLAPEGRFTVVDGDRIRQRALPGHESRGETGVEEAR